MGNKSSRYLILMHAIPIFLEGDRRGKAASQTNLTVWADLLEDLPDLGLEAHVQHPVCLVEDQVGAPPQVGLAHLKKVNQSARGGNHDLAASLKVTQLGTLRGS